MHPRLEEVLNYLDTERRQLRDAVGLFRRSYAINRPVPIAGRWRRHAATPHDIEKRIGGGLTKWVGDAKAAVLGRKSRHRRVLHSLDLALIGDRSRRRNAPTKSRQRRSRRPHRRGPLWSKREPHSAPGVMPGDGLALTEVIQPHLVLGPINLINGCCLLALTSETHGPGARDRGGVERYDTATSAI